MSNCQWVKHSINKCTEWCRKIGQQNYPEATCRTWWHVFSCVGRNWRIWNRSRNLTTNHGKWWKNIIWTGWITFFGFAADNYLLELTLIPVYMGIQPIKLKNIFPLILQRATGLYAHSFKWTGGIWAKILFLPCSASSSLSNSKTSMVTPQFLSRFWCTMVPAAKKCCFRWL